MFVLKVGLFFLSQVVGFKKLHDVAGTASEGIVDYRIELNLDYSIVGGGSHVGTTDNSSMVEDNRLLKARCEDKGTSPKLRYCKYEGCSFKTQYAQSLWKHHKRHSRELMCGVCQREFALKYELKEHMELKHSEKTLLCEVCSKTFTSRRGLKKHSQTHTEEPKY